MNWNKAFSYLPIDYGTVIGTIEDITQRTVFLNNISGEKVKIRFSNRYGRESLILEKVVIAKRKDGGQIKAMAAMTYKGDEKITIAAGEEFYSDELEWSISAGESIILSVYIKEKSDISSACQTWKAESFYTRYRKGGDFTLDKEIEGIECRSIYPYVDADPNKSNVIVGISEILIEGKDKAKNITMFGDSITHMSYYSDALFNRLSEGYKGKGYIVNRGIGGNRLLHDASYMEENAGHGNCFGIAGMTRYKKDIFEDNVPDAVLILEGVNDIMHPYVFEKSRNDVVSAAELIEGMSELINCIHDQGAKVYLGTIMPFKLEEEDWVKEADKVRNGYNDWVRTQKLADGIMDFDRELRDEKDRERLKAELHIGDGLHPNTLGGIKMADLVLLEDIMED